MSVFQVVVENTTAVFEGQTLLFVLQVEHPSTNNIFAFLLTHDC